MSDKEEKKESKDPSLLKAFTVEAKDRCFSAKDRWLKVLGIIFIPFIYGFVCIAAFWNPLAKIGSIPMSIASLDQEKVLVQDYDTSNNPMDDVNGESKGMCLGIPEMWSDALPNTENINFTQHFPENLTLDEYKTWGESHVVASVLTEGGSVLDYSHTISSYNGNVQSISFMDSMMTNWQNGDMSDIFKFNSKQNLYEADINESLKISNIKY
ncbi:MAG: hypothetical protein LBM72_00145, partial [Mycoplasmataceae bacterium]|nr:hypothetical protein [Mycoplasmataceae bacterium]